MQDEEQIEITEHKIKHLEFIQGIIERTVKNSFLLKGWCLTVLFALMTLSTEPEFSKRLFYAVVLSFYFLDTYFLYQEERFIDLYNYVRKKTGTDFSLKVKKPSPKALWNAIFSFKNAFFYFIIALIVYFIHF
ncbi:MAG: hypothetical protein PHX25_01575 [Candidatus Pacebacteria bacterium]|nr:hypothetical protein [Candidatus Paceibacterota bacterium]